MLFTLVCKPVPKFNFLISILALVLGARLIIPLLKFSPKDFQVGVSVPVLNNILPSSPALSGEYIVISYVLLEYTETVLPPAFNYIVPFILVCIINQ
jgi:hypothetical protein